jgi:uracil-DNA glycosylase family 4
MTSLKRIKADWKDCNECGLGAKAHNHVFFRGECPCEVLFIGEAPGKDEDLQGVPFIGRAGDTFNDLIRRAKEELGQVMVRDSFTHGVTNVLACRPVGIDGKDRTPRKDEAKSCSPRLRDTIKACNPKLIILLGRSAENYYKMVEGVVSSPVVHLEHPAFINYNGGIGSSKYDSVLVRLVDMLEKHLYGEKQSGEGESVEGKAGKSGKSRSIRQKAR